MRETLGVLREILPLTIHEVPSGKPVFDWTVPAEWNLNHAFVEDQAGERVIDSAEHNLHVVSYSTPIDAELSREELDAHLHSLPDQPDLIPYRTSYFNETWGFCVQDSVRQALPEGPYRVVIDASLEPGSLTYGEVFLPGATEREILISTHICHPSLANDNLSGIAVASSLAQALQDHEGPYGLRFVFVPGTIGAITWLAENEGKLDRIAAGLVLSGVGDPGPLTYKRSRRGDGMIDRLFAHALAQISDAEVRHFLPYGYDERQYCSPGIDIAAGCLMRTPYGEYPEYHTSGDNLALLSTHSLEETRDLCLGVLEDVQRVRNLRNLNPKCEPQLGRRGLYEAIGGDNDSRATQLALLWLLSYSDGNHSTLDISELSGISLAKLDRAAGALLDADLLEALA